MTVIQYLVERWHIWRIERRVAALEAWLLRTSKRLPPSDGPYR